MLSKHTRDLIVKTGVAVSFAVSAVGMPTMLQEPILVEAATVIATVEGTLTVKAASLWTYDRPDWNARHRAYAAGTTFRVVEKLRVVGGEMYRLENGLFITANASHVTFAPSSPPQVGSVVGVNTTARTSVALNLRSGASTQHSILLTMPKGASVIVLSSAGGWSHVEYNGKRGYASSSYLTVTKSEENTPAPVNPSPTTHVTTANLNLRSGASTQHSILLTIPSGKEVRMLSSAGGWARVEYGTQTGYVSMSFLTTLTVSAPPVAPTPEPPAPPAVEYTHRTSVNLNLRSGASTQHSVLLTMPSGAKVVVVSVSGTWAKVLYEGREGFAHVGFLEALVAPAPIPEPEPQPEPPPAVPAFQLYRTTVNLNLRAGAGTGFSILATMPRGTEVKVFDVANGWAHMEFDGRFGYAAASYLTEITEDSTTPVVSLPVVLTVENLKTSYNNEHVALKGFSVSESGLKEVKATVNGQPLSVTRESRPDLQGLYGNYGDLTNSGFKIHIDKRTLYIGTHSLSITAVMENGTQKVNTYTFAMVKSAPVLTIAALSDGQAVPTAPREVTGHALNVDGVAEVRYYINNVLEGKATYGLSSSTGTYTGYQDHLKAGYAFTLNPSKMSKAMNTLRVEFTGKDGTVHRTSVMLRGATTDQYLLEAYPSTLQDYATIEANKTIKAGMNGRPATMDEIRYHLDASNFIHDDVYKFMFLELSYQKGDMEVTPALLDTMLQGRGVLDGMGGVFLKAAEDHGVNPFYLVAHSLLETGNGGSVLARGQKVEVLYATFGDASSPTTPVPEANKDKLVYNVYGIGAWNINANLWGAQRAYREGWFSVEEAIYGGAGWISRNYTNRVGNPQNTLYKMRFNLQQNMNHQYATDIQWAYKQALRIKQQFDRMGVNSSLKFLVPTFKK